MANPDPKDALRDHEVGLLTRLHFAVYGSELGFRLLKGHRKLSFLGARRKRAAAGRELIERTGCPVTIDPELGYRWVEPGELPGMDALIRSCDGVVEEARPHLPRLKAQAPGRYRIAFDLLGDDGGEVELSGYADARAVEFPAHTYQLYYTYLHIHTNFTTHTAGSS